MAEQQHTVVPKQPEWVRSAPVADPASHKLDLLLQRVGAAFQGGHVDPRTLSPHAILALQRTAGNTAVNQLLQRAQHAQQQGNLVHDRIGLLRASEVPARPSAHAVKPKPGDPLPVVQRMFGMEIELQAVLTDKAVYQDTYKSEQNIFKRAKAPVLQRPVELYVDPLEQWQSANPYPTVQGNGVYDVKVDHNSRATASLKGKPAIDYGAKAIDQAGNDYKDEMKVGPGNDTHNARGAIVELVTKPMDENLGEGEVRNRVGQLVTFANGVSFSDNGRVPLSNLMGGSPPSVYVGMQYNAGTTQKKIGEIQATYGVRLDRINQLVSWKATRAQAKDQTNKASTWSDGASYAQTLVTMPLPVPIPGTADVAEQQRLQGLLTLVCVYLVARKQYQGVGWGKNHLSGLFYKSKLSDVAGQVGANITPWLATNANILAGHMVDTVGVRGKGMTSTLSCEEWIEEVLTRTDDKVYEENKNPYATNPLGPENVGPTGHQEMGAIMENRSASSTLGVGGGATSSSGTVEKAGVPVDQWVDTAVKVHRLVRAINGTAQPNQNDLDTSVR